MIFLPLLMLSVVTPALAELPTGYWPLEKSQTILDNTEELVLSPDLSGLTPGEREAVQLLLVAGGILHDIYEDANHHQAHAAEQRLLEIHEKKESPETENLLRLYRLFEGPVATTLDNQREPFLPVDPPVPGKNVYPWGIEKSEIESFLAAHPDQRAQILGERTAVRRASVENLDRDLGAIRKYPALDTLHPGLKTRLAELRKSPNSEVLYAVPYAVAWADRLHEVYGLLRAAGEAVGKDDAELADYLHNRARDLLSGNYESGDASWVTGRFKHLNAQVGSYETYGDALYGVKAFHSLSLLLRNDEATRELEKGLGSLQAIEDALPYDHHKKVRDDIPVGAYEVIADFGQSRGTNTATILPNDPLHSRRYGRTILLRENIMRHPRIYQSQQQVWNAAVAEGFENDLDDSGNFYRTLWHEVGHYLGVDRDREGRVLDVALEDYADSLEEMKADLVSLFTVHQLADEEVIGAEQLRAIQASGILRTLQNNRPRNDQPYQRMQLVQFNWFLDQGLLSWDGSELSIDYGRYRATVTSLLEEVLEIQYRGDVEKAAGFFDRWTRWDPKLHGALAAQIRDAQTVRYRLVRYSAEQLQR